MASTNPYTAGKVAAIVEPTRLSAGTLDQKAVYYAAVAGDIRGTYLCWRDGRRDERQMAATYSGQFFDLCKRLGRRGVASFPSDDNVCIKDDGFEIHSRPCQASFTGMRFHLAQLRSALWLWVDVWRSGASDVVVMDGVTSFYLLAPLAMTGRRVFLSIHTVLWKNGEKQTRGGRLINRLNSWFLRRYCAGCLVASSAIGSQVRSLSNGDLPTTMFNPLYRPEDFDRFRRPSISEKPFRILYVGRIETDKGIYDLLAASQNLVNRGYSLQLDYCGDGGELTTLKETIRSSGLERLVFTRGHLSRPELSNYLELAHVVVVPTRSSFPEGLNQVVIEAVLARRPVITSNVCPALQLVAAAALEANSDDVASYEHCIQTLIEDPQLTASLIEAGSALRNQFFDGSLAWTERAFELMGSAN
jgi:glycosyltransferase involved in cell wall biosynthesis